MVATPNVNKSVFEELAKGDASLSAFIVRMERKYPAPTSLSDSNTQAFKIGQQSIIEEARKFLAYETGKKDTHGTYIRSTEATRSAASEDTGGTGRTPWWRQLWYKTQEAFGWQ